ncbi:Pkinase-domain-containing protein [Corynespora cassiicola Philippines]|uniref:Aurora kinase n=1 Tax=Corynespora cassiicola Philippines TaxID=1448308 RepID=A0A2T2NU19_CORCC|nr:Pkinase-domain-containing protein [Corynespora cassiicola Philippines]
MAPTKMAAKQTKDQGPTEFPKSCGSESILGSISNKEAQPIDKKSESLSSRFVGLRYEHFKLGKWLGQGNFGTVYLAKHKPTSYICVLKIIDKSTCTDEEEENLFRRELEVHQNLSHANILRLLAWFHDENRIYLVLEYAAGGSLYAKMKGQKEGRFEEKGAAQYIAQMADAIKYMHGKNIMHRDIKPENILLGLHDEIKLADFGYSVHSSSGHRKTICGTVSYLSPEVAIAILKPRKDKQFYTKAIDRWSLGILAYELLVGKPPFEMENEEDTKEKIANFKGHVPFPEHVSEAAREFILQLLNLDAEERMSLDDIIKHEWIVQHLDMPIISSSM